MAETEILALVARASLFAQAVLLVLAVMLFFVIWFIIRKVKSFRRVGEDSDLFEEEFWRADQIEDIHHRAEEGEFGTDGLSSVFLSGMHEFEKTTKVGVKDQQLAIDGVRRAMEIGIQSELDKLQSLLPYLATAGSSSPYIGLLGTVWGIINAFRSLTTATQATIAQVAPGIAEALIATAMGLFAAIPAVIAYNHLSARVDRFTVQFENFADHFCNIIRRSM